MIITSMLYLLLVGSRAEEDMSHPITDFFTRLTNGFNEMFDPESDYTYYRMAKKQKTQPLIPDDVPFPCDTSTGRSPTRPEDVDHVAPGDIDVVAAIGDGFTTANAARAPNVFFVARENRGLSWSIGGQDTWRKYLTLPNILRLFNPNLIGFTSSGDTEFVAALSNAVSVDLPSLTRSVVGSILNDSRVDVKNDWKLVTIMIGTNDFCKRICFPGQMYREGYESVRKYMTIALDHIRDSLPRTIVNIVFPPVLDLIRTQGTGFCRMLHTIQCPCMSEVMSENMETDIAEIQRIWLRVQKDVAEDERYRRKDFAVVVQPFMKSIAVSDDLVGRSLFAADCVHFSQKGQATAANALWNNILQPVGHKTETWSPVFDSIICPTKEHPYIFTYNNSPNGTFTLHDTRLELNNTEIIY